MVVLGLSEQICLKGASLRGAELSGYVGVFRASLTEVWYQPCPPRCSTSCSPVECSTELCFLNGGFSKLFVVVVCCFLFVCHLHSLYLKKKSHLHDSKEEIT